MKLKEFLLVGHILLCCIWFHFRTLEFTHNLYKWRKDHLLVGLFFVPAIAIDTPPTHFFHFFFDIDPGLLLISPHYTPQIHVSCVIQKFQFFLLFIVFFVSRSSFRSFAPVRPSARERYASILKYNDRIMLSRRFCSLYSEIFWIFAFRKEDNWPSFATRIPTKSGILCT